MLSLDDFQPLSLEDKTVFDTHYAKYPPAHSDNVFTTMISWMEYGNYHYAQMDDHLFIMTNIKDKIRFRPPSGERNKTLFQQALSLAQTQQSKEPFGVIDAKTKEWMATQFPKLKFVEHREYFDYVYRSSDLVELPGSTHAKTRNRLNKFKRNYAYTIEPISDDNFEEICAFLKRWCLWKDCESDGLLESERKAIIFSMNHFFDIGLSGLAIRIHDEIEAIAVFEQISHDTAVIHYEKGSPEYDGIYKAINRETAKQLQHTVTFINRESDMGIPGLRKAKLSYRPHHMVEVYHITKDNIIL